MSKWTHPICSACWEQREPNREPVRLREPEVERCCFCGKVHASGIYVREDPNVTACGGSHE